MATKTTTVTFRMDPEVKESLRVAAEQERRSVANMLEVMILDYVKKQRRTGRAVAVRSIDARMKKYDIHYLITNEPRECRASR